MENTDISIDELSEIIQRASLLLSICKDMLGQAENNVNKILSEV
jgi:exodeoxyribonuclease VII small subunit